MKKKKKIVTVADKIGKRPDILRLLNSDTSLERVFELPNELASERIDLYRKSYFGVGDTGCYKVNLPNENKLYIKMEYANSMGNSHYARFWLVYLFIAEILGVIKPGETNIIEVTSGSSGIALAMAAEILDFNVTLLVPSCLPEGRVAPMRRKTTTIIPVDGYIDACIDELRKMITGGGYFATNHSEERADILIHVFSRIGHEFVQQYGFPDYAILGMGNGSTTEAIGRVFRKNVDKTKIWSFRPDFERKSEVVFGLLAPNLDLRHVSEAGKIIDELHFTNDVDLTPILTKFKHDTEISELGYSSLYAIYFAYEISRSQKGKSIFTIGYDKRSRYTDECK